jgi:hypothetical protein
MNKRMSVAAFGFGLSAVVFTAMVFTSSSQQHQSAHAAKANSKKASTKPVEESMHDFLEYVFQPTYKRLKAQMATDPKDNRQAWKAIKSDSLILAEGGNLLLMRLPEENAADWTSHSEAVRNSGGQLYQAARKKDYQSAHTEYTALLTQCNRCHQKFADGKYQLTP